MSNFKSLDQVFRIRPQTQSSKGKPSNFLQSSIKEDNEPFSIDKIINKVLFISVINIPTIFFFFTKEREKFIDGSSDSFRL